MKKADFKKMAQMGMACGMLFAAHNPINADASQFGGTLVTKACGGEGSGGHGCGVAPQTMKYGNNGCNGSPSNGRNDGYTADNSMATQAGGLRVVTDSELRAKLTTQASKDIYEKLSPEAKAHAQRLAGQGYSADDAVNQAAQQASKRAAMYNTDSNNSDDVSMESYNTTSPTGSSANPYNSTSSMSNPNYPSSMQNQGNPYNTGNQSSNYGNYNANPYGSTSTESNPAYQTAPSTRSYNPQTPTR